MRPSPQLLGPETKRYTRAAWRVAVYADAAEAIAAFRSDAEVRPGWGGFGDPDLARRIRRSYAR